MADNRQYGPNIYDEAADLFDALCKTAEENGCRVVSTGVDAERGHKPTASFDVVLPEVSDDDE